MTRIATGVFKKLAIKKQAGQGVIAPAGAAGTATYRRRVTSTIDLAKASYASGEVNESQQQRDMRHGVRSVAGSVSGELSVGGYQPEFESVLRGASSPAIAIAAVNTIVAAQTGGAGSRTGTYTRGAGSFITDGFKLGDVCTATGWTAPATDNNNHNFVIIGLTALVMTVLFLDARPIVAKVAGDPVIIKQQGRKVWTPASAQTRDYHTIEHWFSDIAVSEVFWDCVFTGFTVGLPATGMATVEFPVMGLDMLSRNPDNVEYFTNPAASPKGPITAAVNGVLLINGALAGIVTGLTITAAGGHSVPGGVVGSNVDPDVLPGVLGITGSTTVLFTDTVMRNLFLNENEGQIVAVLTGDNTPAAPFVAFNMSRVKYTGATKDDTAQGLTQTMPFTALENINADADPAITGANAKVNLQTTLVVQDSAFV